MLSMMTNHGLHTASTDVLTIIFSKMIKEHICFKDYRQVTRRDRSKRPCACDVVKSLSLVCTKWRDILYKNTRRWQTAYHCYNTSYQLSFKHGIKTLLSDKNEQLCIDFMRYIKKDKCGSIGERISSWDLYVAFKNWNDGQHNSHACSLQTFKKLISNYIKGSSMNFRLIDM